MGADEMQDEALLQDIDALGEKLATARQEIGQSIIGQEDVVTLSLAAMLS